MEIAAGAKNRETGIRPAAFFLTKREDLGTIRKQKKRRRGSETSRKKRESRRTDRRVHMIQTRQDLREYLEADRRALGITRKRPAFLKDEIWRYEIALRYREYYTNQKRGLLNRVMKAFWALVHHRKSVQLGLQVPPNVCGPGLCINHYGLLIISHRAKIGKNFNVHQGVNIGINIDPDRAPQIGDDVFIGPGAKLYGDIVIGDRVAVSAGSVVNRSFPDPDVTIGGVPARVIHEQRGNPFV